VAAIIAGTVLLFGWMAVGPLLSPQFESHVRQELADYFAGDASFRSLRVTIFPQPAVWGDGFELRYRGRTDLPPLVAVDRFSASATWTGLLRRPRRVSLIRLERLAINLPPREKGEPLADPDWKAVERPAADAPADKGGRPSSPVVIDRIETPGARLSIFPRDRAKPPRIFDIHALTLHDVATDRPMRFEATLTNPKPPGSIETSGSFGPWAKAEPGDTPLHGSYTFDKADLGVFKGIGGTLASRGKFGGALGRIAVVGATTTPDFQITLAGNPVPLDTTFQAIVDGTNGNTWLKPVTAKVLSSTIVADGGIVRTGDQRGREIDLAVRITEARIEDLLRLAVKGAAPLMTGEARIETRLRIPPGDEDVIRKLELDGTFHIGQAKFTSVDVQRSIGTLSQRGRGRHDAAPGTSTVSDLKGAFRLRRGSLTFSSLQFAVPGAVVRMAGTYNLVDEQLDFRGTLRLQASLSQTVGGAKSVFLKLIDPFFRRNGAGAELPIKVDGARAQPKFGLDARALLPGD
jgi:hypothetical protein